MKAPNLSLRRVAGALALILAAQLALSGPLAGDDRDLFRASSETPYLFILFDTTGSMNWVEASNTTPPRHGDDEQSRIYRAKRALDSVMQTLQSEGAGVNFGFATFPNQDELRFVRKSTLASGARYFFWSGGVGADDDIRSRVFFNGGVAYPYCDGWEGNDDTSEDDYGGYNTKWTTQTINDGLRQGDIIPLNWANNNIQAIRNRLAPNIQRGLAPNYRSHVYFRNASETGEDFLRLRRPGSASVPAERPFVGEGSTPLAASLYDFRDWYDDWKTKAGEFDPQFELGCRPVNVVLLTDGFETCGGSPTSAATALKNAGVKTYVIGFSTANNALNRIAQSGGTDATPGPDGLPDYTDGLPSAYFAGDEQALVDAFLSIIGEVKLQARTFATAAVPSVVGSTSDEVFLTSFNPVEDGASIWPGRVDAYVKPIPLTTNAFGQEVPNRNKRCSGASDSSCLAWDAAKLLVDQAPLETEVNSDNYKVSNAPSDRRVYYAQESVGDVPLARRLFVPPSDPADQLDLYGATGMGLDPTSGSFAGDGRDAIRYILKKKSASILDPVSGNDTTVEFVLGDIFHSDPVVLGEPSRFDYFSADLEGQTAPCDSTNDRRDRYPCFLRDHLYRRKVLFLGSNEGQLHAFDAGRPFENTDGFVEFTFGTGQELFSFVPRSVLPSVLDMSKGGGQQFTVDGTVTIDDVLIDPESSALTPPDVNNREWRSVLVGGLREGGRAYYALDVTQPDNIAAATRLPVVSGNVPGCIDGGSDCGPVPYATPLWEFTDTWDEDQDNPGAPDLGDTWSRVNIGRIRLLDGTDTVTKYVAIFGGGLDADFKDQPVDPITGEEKPYSGNYLYMVDIETGKTIYKRRLDIVQGVREAAMAVSEAAAVDTDQDSYLDTVYIGTTAGYLFKIDLRQKVELERNVGILDWSESDPATGSPPVARRVDRIMDSRWDPIPIFDTGARPIYFPPSVIFVSRLASYALAWGVGDREDLWNDTPVEGRFYVLLDEGFSAATIGLPLDESRLESIDADASKAASPTGNLLTNPDSSAGKVPGWVLRLDANERVIAKSTGLAGVIFFNSYIPDLSSSAGVCSSSGSSRLYSVFATNGLGIRTSGARYKAVSDFTTRPFIEASGAIKKGADPPTAPPDECDGEELAAMAESIKSLMPAECKFANYRLNVMTLESTSGLECLVPVPVCIIERNWKEF